MTGDTTSTGPGGVTAGLPEYQAVLRAAKRKPILRKSDTTWAQGCTPAQVKDCIYGSWYLLDTAHERVVRGPEETEHNLYTRPRPNSPPGAKLKAVRVNPGTVLVQAHPLESAAGKVTNPSPNSWYVLNDDPVLERRRHHQPDAEQRRSDRAARTSRFGFTSHGKSVFEQVTKEIAQRGQEAQLPGVTHEAALQHFAVVLDGQLITVPSIDFTQVPRRDRRLHRL